MIVTATLPLKPLVRNPLLDYLKGFAIFLVVWGHTIQFGSTNTYDFFANPIFALIYTFHMPLFMAVSGYLFYHSQAKRSFQKLAQTKITQILIPLLLWAVIALVINNSWQLRRHPETWPTILTVPKYVATVTAGLWFLWASLFCSLLTALISKKLGDRIWVYVTAALLVMLLPNDYSLSLIKFMLPYFFAGYLYHKYAARLEKFKMGFIYLSFLLYPLLVLAWTREAYIYLSGPMFSLFGSPHDLLIIAYRYLIGGFGIILIAYIMQYLLLLPKIKILSWLGKNSLGIYLIGSLLIPFVIIRLHYTGGNSLYYSLLLTPAVSIGIAIFSAGATELLSKVPLANRFLLGGRNVPIAPKAEANGDALVMRQNV